MQDTRIAQGSKDDPAAVARQGFEAMLAGDDQVVPGSPANVVQSVVARLVPDRVAAAFASYQLRPWGSRHR